MSDRSKVSRSGLLLCLLGSVVGCKAAHPRSEFQTNPEPIIAASHEMLASVRTSPSTEAATPDDPFADTVELELEQLTVEVLRRNPSVQAMGAAWRAAAERYPQVISLDDPMFGTMLGPASMGSGDVDFGWMVEGSQKIQWPGKRQLRGSVARAEADAAHHEIEETRLKLTELTAMAFLDYYVAHRELALNRENIERAQEFQTIALGHVAAGKVRQQDVLQADLDILALGQRRSALEQNNNVAAARINTLLHQSPSHKLPRPPAKLSTLGTLPLVDELQKLAIDRRPDLDRQAASLRADEAALELAAREFYPDFEFVARYDAFWQTAEKDLRPQVGINLNLPLAQKERRCAAVREAIAKLEQRRAQLAAQIDQVHLEVQAAVEGLTAARKILEPYFGPNGIISKAELSFESARAVYESSMLDFLRVIDAQRQLINHRDKQVEAEAEYHRRKAELERVLGGALAQE